MMETVAFWKAYLLSALAAPDLKLVLVMLHFPGALCQGLYCPPQHFQQPPIVCLPTAGLSAFCSNG